MVACTFLLGWNAAPSDVVTPFVPPRSRRLCSKHYLVMDEPFSGLDGGFGLGRFIVHGAGKKHGEIVDLHPELRALVDEVLSTGYLSEAEAAYQRGEIPDYYLFPGGKLKRGSVPYPTSIPLPAGAGF
jgi:hypothetical protein